MSRRATKPSDFHNQAEEQRKAQIERNPALIEALNLWEQVDQQEQLETLTLLMRSLDEDRLSSRGLFAQP